MREIGIKMATTRRSKRDNSENLDDQNSTVYWLKKIYEKIEEIEKRQQENTELLKKQQNSLKDIAVEVCNIKENMYKGSVENKDTEQNKGKPTGAKSLFSNKHLIQQHVQSRKFAYYNQLRSAGIASIYKSFLDKDSPFIPHKFREGRIPGESEARRERMKKLEIMKVKIEVEGLEEECSKHQAIMDEAEKQVENIIGKFDDPAYRQQLKEQWITDIKREEEKSEQVWQKKESFFKELPNNEGRQERASNSRSNQDNNWRNSRKTTYQGSYNNGAHQNYNWQNRSGNFHHRWTKRHHQ